MGITPDQVRSVDEETRRIDNAYRDMSAGRATLCAVAELARNEPRLIGTGDLQQFTPARCAHVGRVSVGVHPDFRRQGVARTILEQLVAHARACGLMRLELYVRSDNFGAHSLYRTLGFYHEATRARFVRLEDGTFLDDRIWAQFLE